MYKNLIIDRAKCVSCGLCIKDCIANALEFDEDKKPKFAPGGENRCIECRHCLAICPAGALSILGLNPDNSEIIEQPDSQTVLNAIKYRRSTRIFKNEQLSEDVMDKLKTALNYTPTGCNDHRLLFTITENKDDTDRIRNYVIKRFVHLLRWLPFAGAAKKFAGYKKLLINGKDVIYRNAPHIIVASSPVDAPCSNIDPVIALSYFEIYANSLGVGTCWCGLGQACFKIMPELKKVFNIPDGYKPVYVMLFGIPDVKYARTTQPAAFEYRQPNTAILEK